MSECRKFISLVSRNTKCYFKDKFTFFISLFTPLILLLLFVEGHLNDFRVSPIKGTSISLAYFVSNFFVTFLVMMTIMAVGHIYLACVGWYISVE